MKKFFTCLLLLCASVLPRAFSEDAPDDKIKQAMQRKVSFEFVDTPLVDAVSFIRQLANLNMVIDPRVIANNPAPINLRVNDMTLETALSWITRLVELEAVERQGSIYISTAAGVREYDQANALKKTPALNDSQGLLRLRFANGDILEADAQMIAKFPGLMNEFMSLAYDPARDKILALAPGKDFPPQVSWPDFVTAMQKAAPKAHWEFNDELKIMMVTSPDQDDLRKINALARALRRANNPAVGGVKTQKVMEKQQDLTAQPKTDKQLLNEKRLKIDAQQKVQDIQKPVKPPKPPETTDQF